MEKDGDRPRIDRSATALGVRIRLEGEKKPEDIPVDDSGRVSPSTGGNVRGSRMEVAPHSPDSQKAETALSRCDWQEQPRLLDDGVGKFVDGPLAPGLNFPRDKATHGLVEPAQVVSLETYEADLAATRDQWIIDKV